MLQHELGGSSSVCSVFTICGLKGINSSKADGVPMGWASQPLQARLYATLKWV